MAKQENPDSLWSDFELRTFVPETDVPARANDLSSLVDEWFSNHKEYIDPFNWQSVDKQYVRKKAFLEVSGYLLNARGVADEQPLPEIHDLIVDKVNDRRFAHLTARSPRELHHFALPFIYGKYVGELDSITETRLEKTIRTGAFWNAERVPYRHLEYWYIFTCFSELFGFERGIYDAESALENSLVNHQPNVIRCLLPDAYCLTHDLLYYNNFLGIVPDVFPDDPAPYPTEEVLRGLILRYMAEDNCDIVLELVCVGVLQRQISRQMVQLVISWIWEKVENVGYVPGPDLDKTAIMNLPEVDEDALDVDDGNQEKEYESEREKVWEENFHTNEVAGFTARIIECHWDELESRPTEPTVLDRSYRREIAHLGQLLQSLGNYNLKKGARQLSELAGSPVMTSYAAVSNDAVTFLEEQRTTDGEFGYWTREEIVYTNTRKSPDSFRTEMVEPISEACRKALEEVEQSRESQLREEESSETTPDSTHSGVKTGSDR